MKFEKSYFFLEIIFFTLFFLVIVSISWSCRLSKEASFVENLKRNPSSEASLAAFTCDDYESYLPDTAYLEHFPMRYVRVNFHFMQNGEGKGNFTNEKAHDFARLIVDLANNKLRTENYPMNLPQGNTTPVLPQRYQYVLTPSSDDPKDEGIYIHQDEALYYMIARGKHKNNYDNKVVEKYAIFPDSILNIFVMGQHLDSLASPTYRPQNDGICLRKGIKVVGWYYDYYNPVGGPDSDYYHREWYAQNLLNHEIGHALGLQHTWRGNDGCEDTPNHPNCWAKRSSSPCNTQASNNFMDYNIYQNAWSPCQIGKIHQNFGKLGSRSRQYLVKTWCEKNPSAKIEIKESVTWSSHKDLAGDIIIKRGGRLYLSCRLSLPEGGKIKIYPGGELILDGATIYNDCGMKWEGIEILDNGKEKGIIKMLAKSDFQGVEHSISVE